LWAKEGYDVKNDIDIVASKLCQINKAVGGGVMFSMMNEDDVFGLIHPEDKKLFNTETGDPKQDAINYGRARAIFLASLYKRVRQMCPDSSDIMPACPAADLAYGNSAQLRNEKNCLDWLQSFTKTLKEMGVLEHMPTMYTGGGTDAEVITAKTIEDWRVRCNGAPIMLYDNNFPYRHLGAFETDPKGPRSVMQTSPEYPAGYREKTLYKHIQAFGWGNVSDHEIHNWCQSQFMWNMLGLDREKVNALAVRKVCDAQVYPVLKSYVEEFDCPACYLADENGDHRIFVVTNRLRFSAKKWYYDIDYTDDRRVEAQRYREKFARLLPQLQAKWNSKFEKQEDLNMLGYNADNFSAIYLAYGYIGGWTGQGANAVDVYKGKRLRDLLLDAEDLQQRYLNGPNEAPGKSTIIHGFFSDLLWFYTHWESRDDPTTPADSKYYTDIWAKGLLGKFFNPLYSVSLVDIPDSDPRLTGKWGKIEEDGKDKFRTVTGEASIKLDTRPEGCTLVRAKIGMGYASITDFAKITISAGNAKLTDAVSKPRWVTWLLPKGTDISQLTVSGDKPVRVYAVELYRAANP